MIELTGITLVILFSACCINSQHIHCYAKSQDERELNFLLSDTRFANTCSFTMHFKTFSACYAMLGSLRLQH